MPLRAFQSLGVYSGSGSAWLWLCIVLRVDDDGLGDARSARRWESRRAWRLAERAADVHGGAMTGTWRTPLFYRVFFPVVGLYLLYGVVVYSDGWSDLGTAALITVLGVSMVVGPFTPIVRLDEHTVYARGLVLSRVLPLMDVVDVRPGYWGLSIETADGSVFEATAVGEKWDIAQWLGRRTVADSISDTILDAAAVTQYGQRPGPTVDAGPASPV